MKFRLLFYSKILKSMILWFVICEFGLGTSAYEFFFFEFQSWPFRVKVCDIPRGVKICKLVRWRHKVCKNLQAIIASEGNKRRSGKFFVTGRPVLASCNHLLGGLCVAYIFERRSQKSTLLAIAKRRMRRCCSVHFEQSFHQRLLKSGDPLQWRCLNKDSVVVLSSLHTNWKKLRGSEDFNWNNIGLASSWFVWFCRHASFRPMISCRQDMLAR